MARKSFSVLFFIKKGKLLKNGEAPVCMRITVNGCMVDISIKRSCPVNLWNQAKENSKGKDRMSVELNHYLEITRSHVHQIYRELETSGKVITVDLVRKLFYGVDEDNKTLLQVFREHNEQSRKLIVRTSLVRPFNGMKPLPDIWRNSSRKNISYRILP